MSGGSPPARRGLAARAAASALLALLPAMAAACAALADERPAAAPSTGPGPPQRPRVLQPRIELVPGAIEVEPGSRVQFEARVFGGEAMRFSVDWSIREGAAGGTIAPSPAPRDDGSYTAQYQAPGSGGSFHVVARLHEFPAATAQSRVQVRTGP